MDLPDFIALEMTLAELRRERDDIDRKIGIYEAAIKLAMEMHNEASTSLNRN